MEPYCWSTDECHFDNTATLSDYLENHLPDTHKCLWQDGNEAEVQDRHGHIWSATAGGDGDSFNHVVTFTYIDSETHNTEER